MILQMKGNTYIIALIGVMLFSVGMMQAQDWTAPEEANSYKNPYAGNAKASAKGRKIYQKLCWSCHGTTGIGDGPAAAALTTAPTNYTDPRVQDQTDGAIFWKINNGRGAMTSFETSLTEDQRWMLVNYIRELGDNSVP